MSKVALDRVTSSFGFQAAFNNILSQIEKEFSENVLYRKNPLGEPNAMSVDIDMGNNDILNVGLVSASDFRINGVTITQSLQDALEEVAAYPAEAMGYRDEALAYRDEAQGFANASSMSATNSQNFAIASEASAIEAHASELAAEAAASTAAADVLDNIAPAHARGVLSIGEDTITLPWAYDNTSPGVSVFLNGLHQDPDVSLTYPTNTTIVLNEPVTETTNWVVVSLILTADSTLSAYVDQCQTIVDNAALSNLPVGSLIWVTGVNAPAGFVVGDGELRSRAAFPDLWAFAQSSGNISVDDASWTVGQYSPGDGSTTFRVPRADDRFIRAKSATRPVGLVEEDAFQGHWHNWYGARVFVNLGSAYTAARVETNDGTINSVQGAQADGINGTPRTADETRPKALTYLPCIKAYDVIASPAVLNAVGFVNELARLESEKLRKDENINLGVSVPASGTAVDFIGIPEGVKRITVMFDGVSTNGTSYILFQLGSGAVENAGYRGAGSYCGATASAVLWNTGFVLQHSNAANLFHGSIQFTKHTNNLWVASGNFGLSSGAFTFTIGGAKTLSGILDRLRVTCNNLADQFDSGTINIAWEF